MISKKSLLKHSQFYAIIDKKVLGRLPLSALGLSIKNSRVEVIQFRDKSSGQNAVLQACQLLQRLFLKSKKIFIVNDYLEIAKIVGSDGIHLGQDDLSIETARRILGPEKIIGVSCHSLSQARKAQRQGADYISIGPIFSTATKPEYKPIGPEVISKIKREIKIPFFAIGGIKESNIRKVAGFGASRIAVCSAILKAKSISRTVRILRENLPA